MICSVTTTTITIIFPHFEVRFLFWLCIVFFPVCLAVIAIIGARRRRRCWMVSVGRHCQRTPVLTFLQHLFYIPSHMNISRTKQGVYTVLNVVMCIICLVGGLLAITTLWADREFEYSGAVRQLYVHCNLRNTYGLLLC